MNARRGRAARQDAAFTFTGTVSLIVGLIRLFFDCRRFQEQGYHFHLVRRSLVNARRDLLAAISGAARFAR
jgi:hypothetical protein